MVIPTRIGHMAPPKLQQCAVDLQLHWFQGPGSPAVRYLRLGSARFGQRLTMHRQSQGSRPWLPKACGGDRILSYTSRFSRWRWRKGSRISEVGESQCGIYTFIIHTGPYIDILHTHTHIYIYMYVCMYVRTYVRMYVCMYACMHACMHVCMYVYTYSYTHTYIYIYQYTLMYILKDVKYGTCRLEYSGN